MSDLPMRIELLTIDLGILYPETTGLLDVLQAVRFAVSWNGQTTTHVVVKGGSSPRFICQSSLGDIERLFAGDAVSLIESDQIGAAGIRCSATSEVGAFQASAAAATLKRAWGWDETPTIGIDVLDSPWSYALDPVFAGYVWNVARTTSRHSSERTSGS